MDLFISEITMLRPSCPSKRKNIFKDIVGARKIRIRFVYYSGIIKCS